MKAIQRFNIRVYGLILNQDRRQVLVSEEYILGKKVIKFPGGGLEFYEGTIDCLQREFKEELNVEIKVGDHFYTTDFFQESAFDNSQVISIYYLASIIQNITFPFTNGTELFYFLSIKELKDHVGLPIDKIVCQKLIDQFIL